MAEPGWRTDWVARLSWLRGYENEDAAGLILQHHYRALDLRAHPQFGPRRRLASSIRQMDEDDLIEGELVLRGGAVD